MDGIPHAGRKLLHFAWLQARCCAFAVALIGGIAASTLLPELPVARYDLVLVYGVALALLARRLGWDSARDTTVIAACHVIGLLFELVKVQLGSWSYPEAAFTKIAGVPLYGGFLYAAVGSYVCRAWQLMELHLTGYRPRAMAVLAAAVYVNFFTHHWLPDIRWPLAAALVWATARARVCYRVGGSRHHMPLCVSFVLIGFFLWVAENAATFAGAWSYPHQLDGWQPVTISKAAAWALLISVTFVLVASSKKAGPALPPGEEGAGASVRDAGTAGSADATRTKIGDTRCATESTSSTSGRAQALRACCAGRGTRRNAASTSRWSPTTSR